VYERSAESGEVVSGRRWWRRFPQIWLLLLAHLQFYLKFACKFISWYLHHVDKLTSKKFAKTINLLCPGNKVFVKYQVQGGVTPTPLAHALAEYKPSAHQASISEEHTSNATIQQFITAKILGCALKQGSKTRSSLRQSNLQLQNEAALMSCRIRAAEHKKCVDGLAGTHPGLQDGILQNYTRIENAHEVRKKTLNFLLCIEVQQTFSFPFSLLRHYRIPECFYVKKKRFLSSCNSFIMLQK